MNKLEENADNLVRKKCQRAFDLIEKENNNK